MKRAVSRGIDHTGLFFEANLIAASRMWLLPDMFWRVNCVFNFAMIRTHSMSASVSLSTLCLRVLTQSDRCIEC